MILSSRGSRVQKVDAGLAVFPTHYFSSPRQKLVIRKEPRKRTRKRDEFILRQLSHGASDAAVGREIGLTRARIGQIKKEAQILP